ncbi:MAG: DUF1987 domain-containing protein [Magnetospirillum sp.]|nr:DUF1987 domain-containing protein [Magnetospirillum sp.]
MENLTIHAGERSPEVRFDAAARTLSLRGESYPEDASAVFGPIFAWLHEFFAGGGRDPVRVDFELVYFNSSSAKALMNIFQQLDRAAGIGTPVTVNWRYAADDETMKEFGEDFSEDLAHVSFHLVETQGAG